MKLHKKPIRVLIVDDSAFMRKIINDLLDSEPAITVIGHARNGEQALQMIDSEKPDIITLDIEMPVLDGLKTLEIIMNKHPLPVIMLSSLTEEGSTQTIRALELGAVDFIQKPTLSFMITSSQFKEDLITKIKASITYQVNPQVTLYEVLETKQRNVESIAMPPSETNKMRFDQKRRQYSAKKIVAIAVSTGGPKALQSVIPKLPGNLPVPVLIVQHMPPGFTKSLADRLNQLSDIHVKEAEDGEIIKNSHVYIAPGDYHMKVRVQGDTTYIELSQDAPVGGHRPAADQLFDSIANYPVEEAICVVMTGMGSDGTRGIERLRNSRPAYVIAQNEESCVVYGMPKSVSAAGLVDQTAPLDNIADIITNRIGGR